MRPSVTPPSTKRMLLALFAVFFSLISTTHTVGAVPTSAHQVAFTLLENSIPPLKPASSVEQKFVSSIDGDRCHQWLKYYTSKQHIAGSDNDLEQAIWTRFMFEQASLVEPVLVHYFPLLSYPKSRSLSLLQPQVFHAGLTEAVVKEDPTSRDQNATLTFHGYGASGTVKAPIVYVNYGSKADFDLLKQLNVNVSGSIALVRYGHQFRGLKVRAAQEAGCVGVLIYSDPIDDGFVRGPVYPKGPWRPPTGVQRGSVQYNAFYNGDPLTPGYPAHIDSPRIPLADANIPKIPSLPISYADAEPFLKALKGQGWSADALEEKSGHKWQGGLDFDYFTGPAGEVNLDVQNEFKITPIWNVIASIPGSVEPEKTIIIGNHRDAWVFGGVDPSSGSAALMEMAHAFNQLLITGWRPRRTIILASWDAEEYGLVGSTEWVEDHEAWLNNTNIAYLNMDAAASGSRFSASAVPSLASLIRDVAKSIIHPSSNKTVYEMWYKDSENIDATKSRSHHPVSRQPHVDILGAGSDYVPFLDRLGIPSLDVVFSGSYGVYHSNYDSYTWMEKFGDPDHVNIAMAARILGVIALRLAESEVLPFDYVEYAEALETYYSQLKRNLKQAFGKAQVKTVFKPSLHALGKSIWSFRDSAEYLGSLQRNATELLREGKGDRKFIDKLNNVLSNVDKQLLLPNGISPRRKWYKHCVFAPGEWTGYEAVSFPGVSDAIVNGEGSGVVIARIMDVVGAVTKAAIFMRSV